MRHQWALSEMPTITLAETTIGLYKSECVRADFPFAAAASTIADVEYINAAYVAGYTQQRLTHRLGRVPPAEPKPAAIPLRDRPTGPAHRTPKVHEASMKPGMVQVTIEMGQR